MTRDELKDLACLGFSADRVMQSFCHTATYPNLVDVQTHRTLPSFISTRGGVALRPGDGVIHSRLNRLLLLRAASPCTGTAVRNRSRASGLRERQARPRRQRQPDADTDGTARPSGRADSATAPAPASLRRVAGTPNAPLRERVTAMAQPEGV